MPKDVHLYVYHIYHKTYQNISERIRLWKSRVNEKDNEFETANEKKYS